ncbi:MAG TPA: choice-of-anchor D domain-containing protein [Terriglobales bacterium]|nr:choice-of-anchor D domain-containing protein [Terriglobales bacterium]
MRTSELRLLGTLLALASVALLAGCAGVSSGVNNQVVTAPPSEGTLAVSPSTLNFGNVAMGSSASLSGTLTATNVDVTVSSASWSGSGYAVSGITFPATVTVGQSTKYTVTFTPATSGTSSGSISFSSNATDASLKQGFTGDGTQGASTHTVALTWDPSTSTVVGYNIYRGTQSGGPYSLLNSALLPGTSYTDASLQSGTTYFYVSTAVDSNNLESSYSNEASAAIP